MRYEFDSTKFADDQEDLFQEIEWKAQKELIKNGPESISLDISFSSNDICLYGLPERINQYAVKETVLMD